MTDQIYPCKNNLGMTSFCAKLQKALLSTFITVFFLKAGESFYKEMNGCVYYAIQIYLIYGCLLNIICDPGYL